MEQSTEQIKQTNILMVDDDEFNLKLLGALIEADGHAMRCAPSALISRPSRTNGRWKSLQRVTGVHSRRISIRQCLRRSGTMPTNSARFMPPMRIDRS